MMDIQILMNDEYYFSKPSGTVSSINKVNAVYSASTAFKNHFKTTAALLVHQFYPNCPHS